MLILVNTKTNGEKMLVNKEEFLNKPEIYSLLTKLEDAKKNNDEFCVSILLTRLENKGITFEEKPLTHWWDVLVV